MDYKYRYQHQDPATMAVESGYQKECPVVVATEVPHDRQADATMYISAIVDNINREISTHRTDPPEQRKGSHKSRRKDKKKDRGRSKSRSKRSHKKDGRGKEEVAEEREPRSTDHRVEHLAGRNEAAIYREQRAAEVPMYRDHAQLLGMKPRGRWPEQNEWKSGNLATMETIGMQRASSCPHPADPPGFRAMPPRQDAIVERAPRYNDFPSIPYVFSEDIVVDQPTWKLMQACPCQRKKQEPKRPTRPIDVPRGTKEPSVFAGSMFGLESFGQYFNF